MLATLLGDIRDGRLLRLPYLGHSLLLRESDCVQIEDGRRVNIRRVSRSYCEAEVDEFDLHDSRYMASRCDHAKELLMLADSEAELEKAMHKIRKHCH